MSARFAAAAVVAALAVAALVEAPRGQTVVPDAVYAGPRAAVAIGGPRRLNLYCDGSGRPAVLLDAGAGFSMMTWRRVQAEIARFTRVCAYDRAGLGFSDRAERPSDVRNMADDLRRLVRAAPIPVPFVYVGHSLAGLIGLLYASTWPDDVAGFVLVDPTLPRLARDRASLEATGAAMNRMIEPVRRCLALARQGELADPQTPEALACVESSVDPDTISDEALRRAMRKVHGLPRALEASLSELEAITPHDGRPSLDAIEMEQARLSFGAKPLVVLTAGGRSGDPEPAQAWREGHERIAALSTRGRHAIVPGARHFIQIDQPLAVIDAVRGVVNAARGE